VDDKRFMVPLGAGRSQKSREDETLVSGTDGTVNSSVLVAKARPGVCVKGRAEDDPLWGLFEPALSRLTASRESHRERSSEERRVDGPE